MACVILLGLLVGADAPPVDLWTVAAQSFPLGPVAPSLDLRQMLTRHIVEKSCALLDETAAAGTFSVDGPVSFEACAAAESCAWPPDVFLPRVLQHYDLPELALRNCRCPRCLPRHATPSAAR